MYDMLIFEDGNITGLGLDYSTGVEKYPAHSTGNRGPFQAPEFNNDRFINNQT